MPPELEDPSDRFAFLRRFVGFTDEDRRALGESARPLGPHLPALLDRVYDHLLSFDDSRRLFVGSQGHIDPAYMALRKEHLTDWVLTVVGTDDDAKLSRYLFGVANHHTGAAGDPERRVPPRYLVGLTAYLQAEILGILFGDATLSVEDQRRFSLAWTKFLGVQLDIFLKVAAPFFPRWDEGEA